MARKKDKDNETKKAPKMKGVIDGAGEIAKQNKKY